MCRYISGIAVKVNDEVKVYTLRDQDSHSTIRDHYNIVDDNSLRARYQTPIEMIPVRGLDKIEDFKFIFDDTRPDWWTDEMTELAKRQLFRAHMERYVDSQIKYGGDLYLRSLTSLPEGVTLSPGGYLDLSSLTREDVPQNAKIDAKNIYYAI